MTNEITYFSVKEFAKRLRIHPNTVLNGIKFGRIQAFRIGKGKTSMYRIPASEIERMIIFDLRQWKEENLD